METGKSTGLRTEDSALSAVLPRLSRPSCISWKQPAHTFPPSNSPAPQHQRRRAHVHLGMLCPSIRLAEGFDQHLPETAVDLSFRPEVILQILHPFEVRHGDPARVAEDVRDHKDVALA